MDLGELRARLTAEASQMKQEIRAVKGEFASLGDESVKTAEKMERINRLTATLENVNGRIELQRQKLKELKQSYDTTFNPAAKNKLQEQILRTEASLMRLIDTSDKTAKEIWELEASMEAVADGSANAASDMDLLDQALIDIGLNADQIKAIKRNLDTVDPARLERQLEEVDRVLKKLGLDSQEIEKIKNELRGATEEAGKTKGSINALASGIAALGAGMAMKKLVEVTKTLSEEANQLANSYRGLSVVADSFNVSADEAIDLAEELSDRWGLNRGIMADVVKTYTTMNFTLEETERIITATADAAAYNRQAHLSWDEAIKQVAEGIKAGNSNLTDAAGITTNLSVMQDRYARSIGKTAATLTEAEKIQAAYNGMLEEGAIFAGNADDAMTGLNGTQATFKTTLEDTRIELGEAFIPIMEQVLETLQPMIRDFGLWASENKELVAGITSAGIAFTGLIAILTAVITVVAALTAAFGALNISMGAVSLVIAAIAAVAGGVGIYASSVSSATTETLAFANSVEELNQKLKESPFSRSANDIQAMQEQIRQLNELLERRREVEEEIARLEELHSQTAGGNLGGPEEERRVKEMLRALPELRKELKGINETLENMDADTPEKVAEQIERLNRAIDASIPARLELERQNIQEAKATAQTIDRVTQLRDRYIELTEVQAKDVAVKSEIATIVDRLKREYPALHAELSEEGDWRIRNIDILENYIDALEGTLDSQSKTSRESLEIMRQETEAKLKLLRTQIEWMNKAAGADLNENKLLSWLPEGWAEGIDKGVDTVLNNMMGKRMERANELQLLLSEIDKELYQITTGQFITDDGGQDKTPTTKTPTRSAADIQREQYQQALKLLEYKRNLNSLTEEEEIAALEGLLEKYKNNADIRMELEVRIFNLRRQLAEEARAAEEQDIADRFKHSDEWIAAEERRMRELGATEREIAQMRLEAWMRVRNRYESDTEFYKRADLEMYNARMALRREDERQQKEVDDTRVQRTKDVTKTIVSEIDKARKAELDALDERKRAIQKFYDDRLKIIDEAERGRERQSILYEMEKYRLATSEKGKKRYLELQEQLRKMDLEDEKDKIRDERDMQLEALDQQKRDIDAWYSDLKNTIENFSGDFQTIYQLTEDARFAAFVSTNQRIIEEMQRFKQQYEALQPRSTAGASGTDPYEQSILYQMQANAKAWHTADPATRKRLEDDSARLGAQIGAQRINGQWFRDGVPLFHTGGRVGEFNFQTDSMLMPDEIHAILKRSENVFTDGQIGSLIEAISGGGGGGNVYIDKIMDIDNVTLEDRIDIETFGRDSGNVAADVIRKKLVTGSD